MKLNRLRGKLVKHPSVDETMKLSKNGRVLYKLAGNQWVPIGAGDVYVSELLSPLWEEVKS